MRTALRPARIVLVGVGAVVLAACGSSDPASERSDETAPPPVPTIVVTTSILGDVTEDVVGDLAEVEVLMPLGADPHTFTPTAAQAAELRDADLVIANGIGLEAGMAEALAAAEDDGTPVFPVGDELSPIPHAGGADQGEPDPHVWMDPERVAAAALLIADEVAATTGVDPGPLEERALAYGDELREVDEEVQAILAAVPDDRRTLVTADDALGYFAERYGFALVVVEDGGDGAVATPTTHSLGEPGSGADTLAGLWVTNARAVADALSP